MRRPHLRLEALESWDPPFDFGQPEQAFDSTSKAEAPAELTRRTFFKLSGVAASLPLVFRRLEAAEIPSFEFLFVKNRAIFRLDGIDAWIIDPRRFAGNPRLEVEEKKQAIRVALIGARYPGTDLPADLEARCRSSSSGWAIELFLSCGEMRAKGSLVPWLAREQLLRAAARARAAS